MDGYEEVWKVTDYDDDNSESDSWTDWLPDIIGAIEDGTFDEHLKELGIAVAKRAKSELVLKTVIAEGIKQAKALGYMGPRKPEDVVPDGAAAYAVGFDRPIVGEGGSRLIPRTYNTVGTITDGSSKYFKSDFAGKVFRLKKPEGSNSVEWYYDGLLVEVVKVGHKLLQVRFACDPTPMYPTSYKLREYWLIQQKNSGAVLSVPLSWFAHALQAR